MADKTLSPLDEEIRAFLEELKGVPPSDGEFLECKQTLLSLGKAIVNFYSPSYE